MEKNGVMNSFRLTVQERILLHLGEYSKFVDQLEVPFALTQEGIASVVGVVRSAIPRAIKKLISKAHVKEELAHVNGLSRRRKVYYLTTEGLIIAVNLREKLNAICIKLKTSDDKIISSKIQDIPKKLNEKLSILSIILNLDSNNIFDYNQYKENQSLDTKDQGSGAGKRTVEKTKIGDTGLVSAKIVSVEENQSSSSELDAKYLAQETESKTVELRKTIEHGKKYFIEKAPKISYFVGRKAEMDNIYKTLGQKNYKLMVIHGIAGIGKTTLAAKLLNELHDEQSLFWYRCHEWDTIRNFISSISRFLEEFGITELKDYMQANQTMDINEVSEILEGTIKDLNAIFFIDDAHKINEQFLALFTLFREMLERIDGIKLLIFSRSIVPFYDRREVLVKKLIWELELEGLNKEESKELLKYRNIKVENFSKVYEFTKGHPLSLELLDPSIELQQQKNIKMYLEEEVLTRLSIREKSLLKIASAFRYPVPAEGFFVYKDAQLSRETVTVLARKSLINESEDGYEVHDLIRDFFYNYLTPRERIEYHSKIGKFYMNQLKFINNLMKKKLSPEILQKMLMPGNIPDPKKSKVHSGRQVKDIEPLLEQRARGILEAQYHFLMAKDFNRAAEVTIIMGSDLLNIAYVEEFMDNLEKIDLGKISNEYLMDLNIIKADALSTLGNTSEAKEHYKQSIILAESENNKTKLAELYRKLGGVQEKMNDHQSAIEHLNKSLTISKTLGDARGISNAYGGLGDVYWKMAEFNKSNKYYNKCIESAEEITDLPGKVKTYLSLGIISAKQGKFEESIKYYEQCLDILDRGKSMEGFNYSNFYENLSDHYLKTIFSYYIQTNGNDN
jgi:tetratricopeptide (TPR) repeat protein